MGCCGAQNLENLFGSCIRCTFIAGFSSLLFWVTYILVRDQIEMSFVTTLLFGFATLVTILFLAHLLGHADNLCRKVRREK